MMTQTSSKLSSMALLMSVVALSISLSDAFVPQSSVLNAAAPNEPQQSGFLNEVNGYRKNCLFASTASGNELVVIDSWKLLPDGRIKGIIANSGDNVLTSPLKRKNGLKEKSTVRTVSGSRYKLGTPAAAASDESNLSADQLGTPRATLGGINNNDVRATQPLTSSPTASQDRVLQNYLANKGRATVPLGSEAPASDGDSDDSKKNRLMTPLVGGASAIAIGAAIGSGVVSDKGIDLNKVKNLPEEILQSTKSLGLPDIKSLKAPVIPSPGLPIPKFEGLPTLAASKLPNLGLKLPDFKLPDGPSVNVIVPDGIKNLGDAAGGAIDNALESTGIKSPFASKKQVENSVGQGPYRVPMPYLDQKIVQAEKERKAQDAAEKQLAAEKVEAARLQQIREAVEGRKKAEEEAIAVQARERELARVQRAAEEARIRQQADELVKKAQQESSQLRAEVEQTRLAALAKEKAAVEETERLKKQTEEAFLKEKATKEEFLRKLEATESAKLKEAQEFATKLAQAQEAVAKERALQEEAIAKQKSAEEAIVKQKLAEQTRIEELKIAQQKIAEDARMAERTRIAEEARMAQQKAAEDARIAELKAAEEARIAEQKAAEEARIAEQKAAEEAAAREALAANQVRKPSIGAAAARKAGYASPSLSTYEAWQDRQRTEYQTRMKAAAELGGGQVVASSPFSSSSQDKMSTYEKWQQNVAAKQLVSASTEPVKAAFVTGTRAPIANQLVSGTKFLSEITADDLNGDLGYVIAGSAAFVGGITYAYEYQKIQDELLEYEEMKSSSMNKNVAPPLEVSSTAQPLPPVVPPSSTVEAKQNDSSSATIAIDTKPPREELGNGSASVTKEVPQRQPKEASSPFGRSQGTAASASVTANVAKGPPAEPTTEKLNSNGKSYLESMMNSSGDVPRKSSYSPFSNTKKTSYSPFGTPKPTKNDSLYSPPVVESNDEEPAVVEGVSNVDPMPSSVGSGAKTLKASYSPFGAKVPKAITNDSLYGPPDAPSVPEEVILNEGPDSKISTAPTPEIAPAMATSGGNGASYLESIVGADETQAATPKTSYSPFSNSKAPPTTGDSLYAPPIVTNVESNLNEDSMPRFPEAETANQGSSYLNALNENSSSDSFVKKSYSPFGIKPKVTGDNELYSPGNSY